MTDRRSATLRVAARPTRGGAFDRRELLHGLGVASASSLLWAFGCGGVRPEPRTPGELSGEVRTWLRDAVARLAVVYPAVHVLAVSRRRTAAAVDVLGTGVARTRRDGVVLAVRERTGGWREHVTSELTQAGVAAAVRVLVGASTRRASLALGAPPHVPPAPPPLVDRALKARVQAITADDDKLNSRVVYAAAMIDIDDATVWSVSPVHDREQRLVRVKKRAVRAAWNGTRPVVAEVERGWRGGVDDRELSKAEIEKATEDALLLMTPGSFEDKERVVILDPTLAASLADLGVRTLATADAARRPEVRRRLQAAASPQLLTIVDDPTVAGAYGGFAFDDEGVPAAAQPILDQGRVVGVLAGGGKGRGLRPGHVGPLEATPSHLRLAPGTVGHEALRDEGYILEGSLGAVHDPSTDRIVIGAARAREVKNGIATGRVFADIELVGELASLLAGITGVARDTETVPYRDEVDGEPRWRSIEAPYLRTRGYLRARGRRA